jgi:putative transcriptional regulator
MIGEDYGMCDSTTTMAIKLTVRKLVARENMRRAETGEPELTQREIAQGSGVSQPVVSTLIANKVSRIDLKTIDGLCRFFKITPGELFEYVPDEPADQDASTPKRTDRRWKK